MQVGTRECLNSEMLWRRVPRKSTVTVFMNRTSEHNAYFMECNALGPLGFLRILGGFSFLRVLGESEEVLILLGGRPDWGSSVICVWIGGLFKMGNLFKFEGVTLELCGEGTLRSS